MFEFLKQQLLQLQKNKKKILLANWKKVFIRIWLLAGWLDGWLFGWMTEMGCCLVWFALSYFCFYITEYIWNQSVY